MTGAENHSEKTDYSRSRMDSLTVWRREKCWELRSMGLSIDDIVSVIKADRSDIRISHGTVCRDLDSKKQQIERSFSIYVERELPAMHALAITGLFKVVREAWRIYTGAHDDRIRLAALGTVQSAILAIQDCFGDVQDISRAIKMTYELKGSMTA